MSRMFDIARVEVYDVAGRTVAAVASEADARAWVAASDEPTRYGYVVIGKVA